MLTAESFIQRFERLKSVKTEEPKRKLSDKEIKEGRKALAQEVVQCFSFLGQLGEFLPQAGFKDGVIELSIDSDLIHWMHMSERLQQAFKPEFTFQPEEITSFTISCSGKIAPNDERQINIDLKRNGEPWSHIQAGAIVRETYVGPTLNVGSEAPNAQVKAARLGLEALEAWPEASGGGGEAAFLKQQQELSILQDVLNFAVTELESRMPIAK